MFVLHTLALPLTGITVVARSRARRIHLFGVKAAISEQEVNLEGIGADAVEYALYRVGLPLVAAGAGERQCHWLSVGDDIRGAVTVAGRGTVGWRGCTEFTAVLVKRFGVGVSTKPMETVLNRSGSKIVRERCRNRMFAAISNFSR